MSNRKNPLEKFVIRFSEAGLRSQIAEKARLKNRSMNAEIMHRLFHSFELEAELRRAYAVIDQLTAGEGTDGPVPKKVSHGR